MNRRRRCVDQQVAQAAAPYQLCGIAWWWRTPAGESASLARPVMKLHSDPRSNRLVESAERDAIENLGFMHVIVDPPWGVSDDAAADMIGSLSEWFSTDSLTSAWP